MLLLIVSGVFVFIRQKKKRHEKGGQQMERVNDDNPVYATYEVHDNPVAEVRTLIVEIQFQGHLNWFKFSIQFKMKVNERFSRQLTRTLNTARCTKGRRCQRQLMSIHITTTLIKY